MTTALLFTMLATAMAASDQVQLVGDGLKFPEGPAYDGQGNVAVSNCNADYVTVFDDKGQSRILWKAEKERFTFQKTNGMTYAGDGWLYVCDFGRKAVIRIRPDGHQEVYADSCEGKPFRGPNDLAFDRKGNLYFTDPAGSNDRNPIGAVYRVDRRSRAVRRVAEGLAFPNGIAITSDGKTLLVAESKTYSILAYPIQRDGSLGEKRSFAKLPSQHDPDGIALDSAGSLWVAQYGSGAVVVFDRNGKHSRNISLPGRNVTNVEFAGRDLKTLYITEVETGGLYKMRVETPGQPLFFSPKRRK